VWKTDAIATGRLFLPLMLFLTALVLTCAWMQVRERAVLPTEGGERDVELQRERRARLVRLLETGLVCANVGTAVIWVCVAADGSGPGMVGGILGVALAGPVCAIAMAAQLPALTTIADELATLAGTEVLGTRRDGWRWGGLVYYAPDDAALFVPKRSGLGQTLNFARPTAWCLLAGALLMPPLITVAALAGTGD
jgi:uncharacterized membrane protein